MKELKQYIMNDEEFKEWLKGAVSDCFKDLFYYDRKECEEMPLILLQSFEKSGVLNEDMKEQIEYIRNRVIRFGNVSIQTGKLTCEQKKEFSKHFKVKTEPFGYTSFYCL